MAELIGEIRRYQQHHNRTSNQSSCEDQHAPEPAVSR